MIPLISALGFGLWGAMLAKRRRGNRADIAQYATGFAILGALVGLFLSVALARLL